MDPGTSRQIVMGRKANSTSAIDKIKKKKKKKRKSKEKRSSTSTNSAPAASGNLKLFGSCS